MKSIYSIIAILVLLVTAGARADFASDVNLKAARMLSVQHNQTIKTFDTYSRDVLFTITGKSALDDKPAAFIVLDMAFRPDVYAHRNLIYVRNKPFRQDFGDLSFIDAKEKERIVKEGTLSLDFWMKPQTQEAMARIMSNATVKADAINQINNQANTLAAVIGLTDANAIYHLNLLPPITAEATNAKPWATRKTFSTPPPPFAPKARPPRGPPRSPVTRQTSH
ncbi:MAG: hypothetical protein QM754_11265 [Tepidisphaeraceae bacterium]